MAPWHPHTKASDHCIRYNLFSYAMKSNLEGPRRPAQGILQSHYSLTLQTLKLNMYRGFRLWGGLKKEEWQTTFTQNYIFYIVVNGAAGCVPAARFLAATTPK